MRLAATIVAGLVLGLTAARAEPAESTDQARFLRLCESNEPARKNLCLGYILGLVESHRAATEELELSGDGEVVGVRWPERRICTPEGWTARDGAEAVLRYPETAARPGFVSKLDVQHLVFLALVNAYPC